MSESHVTRPEFEIYVKMTAEAISSIAQTQKEWAKESKETNQILREHMINNNNRHDNTEAKIVQQEKEIAELRKAVLSWVELQPAAKRLRWAAGIMLVAFLTIATKDFYETYFTPAPQTQKTP